MFKKQKFYTVYKITNLLNNKIYIGAHETYNINDAYMGSGTNIQKAIVKYGLENFRKEILSCHANRIDMYAEEARLVNVEFLLREDTYNIIEGGGLATVSSAIARTRHLELLEHDPDYKKKYSLAMSKAAKKNKIGQRNLMKGNTGYVWFHHVGLRQNKRVNKFFVTEMLRLGWVRGRKNAYYKPSLV